MRIYLTKLLIITILIAKGFDTKFYYCLFVYLFLTCVVFYFIFDLFPVFHLLDFIGMTSQTSLSPVQV